MKVYRTQEDVVQSQLPNLVVSDVGVVHLSVAAVDEVLPSHPRLSTLLWHKSQIVQRSHRVLGILFKVPRWLKTKTHKTISKYNLYLA